MMGLGERLAFVAGKTSYMREGTAGAKGGLG
jgi:hypothetical protein